MRGFLWRTDGWERRSAERAAFLRSADKESLLRAGVVLPNGRRRTSLVGDQASALSSRLHLDLFRLDLAGDNLLACIVQKCHDMLLAALAGPVGEDGKFSEAGAAKKGELPERLLRLNAALTDLWRVNVGNTEPRPYGTGSGDK